MSIVQNAVHTTSTMPRQGCFVPFSVAGTRWFTLVYPNCARRRLVCQTKPFRTIWICVAGRFQCPEVPENTGPHSQDFPRVVRTRFAGIGTVIQSFIPLRVFDRAPACAHDVLLRIAEIAAIKLGMETRPASAVSTHAVTKWCAIVMAPQDPPDRDMHCQLFAFSGAFVLPTHQRRSTVISTRPAERIISSCPNCREEALALDTPPAVLQTFKISKLKSVAGHCQIHHHHMLVYPATMAMNTDNLPHLNGRCIYMEPSAFHTLPFPVPPGSDLSPLPRNLISSQTLHELLSTLKV